MLRRSAFLILISAFALHLPLRADVPLENELDEANDIEKAVQDESKVQPLSKPRPPAPAAPAAPKSPAAPSVRANEDVNPESGFRQNEGGGVPLQYRQNEGGGAPPTHRQNEGSAGYRSDGSTSEPIFDWSKHQGETEVKHPFAEKGLIRITKDKVYLYKVDPSESHRAMSVQMGMLDPQNLRNPDAAPGSKGSTFKDNYNQTSNPTVLLTREWDEWVGVLGKINLRVGSGVFVAQGHGHFVGSQNQDKVPLENLTFLAFPTSVGVVYRMQFSDRPLFVPFVEGGVTGWAFTEFRDDKKGPKFGVAPSGYAAAGLAVNMTYFDYLTRIHIDREYGITGMFFTVEYRRMQAMVDRYDFSGDYINGGFLMQY